MTLGKAIRVGWVGTVLGLAGCGPPDDTGDQLPPDDPPADVDMDGWTTETGDCDDLDAAVHPSAAERCNRVDDDCDGLIDGEDPDLPAGILSDDDGDGYQGTPTNGCGDDCDDADASIHPGASDAPCNGVDSNCASGGMDLATIDGVTGLGLAEAFALAEPGAEILVCPGTHSIGSVEVSGADAVLRARSGSSDDTTLSGSLSGDGDLVLSDLTFVTADVTWAGQLVVEDVAFVDSRIELTHSGVTATAPALVVRRSSFRDGNRSWVDGGAIAVDVTGGSVLVEQSSFRDNHLDQGSGAGMFLWLRDGSTAVVSDCVFERNYSVFYAGGIGVSGSGAGNTLTIAHSTFTGNSSTQAGAVVAWTGEDSTLALDISTTEFDDNLAYSNDGTLLLNAEHASSQLDVRIADSFVRGGRSGATGGAGALHVSGGDAPVNLDVVRTEFSGNAISYLAYSGCSDVLVEATGAAVHITDTTLRESDSRAYDGMPCSSRFGGADNTITWSGGSILRIEQYQEVMGDYGPKWVYGGYGALYLGLESGNTVSFDNVAFGTDADANQPRDIWECPSNPHVGTTTADLDAANPCP